MGGFRNYKIYSRAGRTCCSAAFSPVFTIAKPTHAVPAAILVATFAATFAVFHAHRHEMLTAFLSILFLRVLLGVDLRALIANTGCGEVRVMLMTSPFAVNVMVGATAG